LLYIDEYDVLASHSAAVGKVNDEHMYYLCSRGLSEEQARGFITRGYLLPVLSYFLDESIKEKAAMTLERRVVNA
jgi:Fe-S cluster assembly protein SufD